jgi:hypothetical protein
MHSLVDSVVPARARRTRAGRPQPVYSLRTGVYETQQGVGSRGGLHDAPYAAVPRVANGRAHRNFAACVMRV